MTTSLYQYTIQYKSAILPIKKVIFFDYFVWFRNVAIIVHWATLDSFTSLPLKKTWYRKLNKESIVTLSYV